LADGLIDSPADTVADDSRFIDLAAHYHCCAVCFAPRVWSKLEQELWAACGLPLAVDKT